MNEINKPENRLDAPQKETENKGLSEHREQIKASRDKLDNLNPDKISEQQKEKNSDNNSEGLQNKDVENYNNKGLSVSENRAEKQAEYRKNIEELNPDGGNSDNNSTEKESKGGPAKEAEITSESPHREDVVGNKPLNADFDNDKFRENWEKDSYGMDDVDYRQYLRHVTPSEEYKDNEPEKATFSGMAYEKQTENISQYVPTEADKNSVVQSKEKNTGSDYTNQSLEISGKSSIMEAKGESNTTPENKKIELPEAFNHLSDSDREKQLTALNKMSDKERDIYLNIAEKEPKITSDVKDVAQSNGAELQGLDYRLKTPSSTYEKMHERSQSVDVGKMNDVIRYTEIYPPDKLADGTNNSLKSYEEKGYTVEKVKNTWNDESNPYNGINTTLKSPDGQKFEVQFHTQESFNLKNGELHTLYEKQRVLSPKDPAKEELNDKMFELSNSLKKPDKINEVRNK